MAGGGEAGGGIAPSSLAAAPTDVGMFVIWRAFGECMYVGDVLS